MWVAKKDIFRGARKIFFWNFSGVPFISRAPGDSSKTNAFSSRFYQVIYSAVDIEWLEIVVLQRFRAI
jgi:hypothetical protein